jgi:large subunit ribosomal protein L15
MKLSSLKPAKGAVKVNDRLGRGHGSGGGGTAKRGHKGAKSRSGYSQKLGFEGGQMPLQRRVPKFGFKNFNRVEYKAINLDTIQTLVENTGVKTVDLGVLFNHGLMGKSDLIKVLGRGEIKAAIDVRVHAFSASAKEAIEKAGGSAQVDTAFNPSADVTISKKVEVAPKTVAVTAENEVNTLEESKPKRAKKTVEGDDLKIIEGIGPKISDLLISAGIVSFADLAATPSEKVKEILEAAGSRFAMHDPSTWGQQATLARDGKWDELKALQDNLNGGKAE